MARPASTLARAGLSRVEVASFVRSDVSPQLADAAEMLTGISMPDGVDAAVLVPNERGLQGALAHRDLIDDVIAFVSASENINRPVADSWATV